MTDRYSAFIVTLKAPVRDDDAEALISAIQMLRGVVRVEPQVSDYVAEETGAFREREKLSKLLLGWLNELSREGLTR